MITKENFFKLLALSPKVFQYLHDASKVGVDFSNSPLFEAYGEAFDIAFNNSFSEEMCDIINSYVFEDLRELNDNGTTISLATPEELWEYVKNYRI